ncbi:hypothetical protein GKE82_13260 [Conexibacter sp. W3-3-2]|uniref:hypothetical protein n=1 Tax=Conexibacter sp. W3-3-2 TaxID=2675227 RepID=UPI0012B755C0|nr:hypothetical protein [Conexibacter sp. W3-3-2]MTD45232.1 hypothetical protein [Conexibacter sp. W3-3-2]
MDLPFPTSPVATRAVDDQAVYAGAAAGSLLVVAAFSTVSGRPHRSFGQDGLLGVSTRLAASPFSALWPSGSQLTLARDGRFTLLGPAVDTRITGERQPLRLVRFTKAGTTTTATVPFRAASVLHDGAGFVAVDGPRLLRLKDDGTPQPPAVTLPGVTSISAARRAADGSLLLAGLVQRSQPRRNRLFVARLTPAGALDRRFWSGGLRLLSFPRAQIGQRLGALLGPVGPGGLVTAVGTSGDGGNDIREDLGPTYLAALRLRTAAPTVGLRSTVARVDPRGRSTLVVRCRAATAAACPTATIIVRHGGRRLGRAVAVAPPPRQDVRVPVALGPTGRRIAGRRGRVVVEVSAGGDAVRAEVTLRRR